MNSAQGQVREHLVKTSKWLRQTKQIRPNMWQQQLSNLQTVRSRVREYLETQLQKS
jgi:hypothetical protein